MPKIIENLEVKLTEEARKQINESGYGAVTIRSIAKACGVGIGTVYNYFPSKDALLATYMLSDWNTCLAVIDEMSCRSDLPAPVAQCIYEQIRGFSEKHRSIFQDEAAIASFNSSFSRYHTLLRSQLATLLKKFCSNDFAPDFISEALLTWTIKEKSFDEIWSMIKNCF